MSFAEMFLRIGGGLGGWIICFAYVLVVSVVGRVDCNPSVDDLWGGTLFLAILAAGALIAVGLGLRWRDSLRWFAAVTAPLAIYAFIVVVPGVPGTTLAGGSLCAIAGSVPAGVELAAHPATAIQRVWPVFQLVVLAGVLVQAYRYWTVADTFDDDSL